jgi:hypothetical protein
VILFTNERTFSYVLVMGVDATIFTPWVCGTFHMVCSLIGSSEVEGWENLVWKCELTMSNVCFLFARSLKLP